MEKETTLATDLLKENIGVSVKSPPNSNVHKHKKNFAKSSKKILNDWQLYLMILPGFVVLLIFCYVPMYGLILSFKEYSPVLGMNGSPWIGFDNFRYAVLSRGFLRLVTNTLTLGVLKLIFAFPSSIILALMINEINVKLFKKSVQTISYLPYFISWIIVHSIVYMFLSTDYGIINNALKALGFKSIDWYTSPEYWRVILTLTNIWKNTGWGTIIFLAGLTSISPDLYEASKCDGANRWQQALHISLPGIMPIIGMTFILSVSGIVKDDFEQIYALVGQNSELYPTTDVLGTWMYRGLRGGFRGWGEATAVGFVQGIVSLILMLVSNFAVKKTGNPGMW